MNDQLKSRLNQSLRSAVETLSGHPVARTVPHLVHKRNGPNTWELSIEYKVGSDLLDAVDWDELGKEIDVLLTAHHADHAGIVGSDSLGGRRLDGATLLRGMSSHLWSVNESWDIPAEELDRSVEEFAAYLAASSVQVTYLAPIINFKLTKGDEALHLPGGITIRRLSDDEYSQLYGGSIYSFGHRPLSAMFNPEFAFTGEYSEPKRLGDAAHEPLSEFFRLQESLDRAILALKTFKSQPVGYPGLLLKGKGFGLQGGASERTKPEYVPFGVYELKPEEVSSFLEHAGRMFKKLHPSLELACSRLADAVGRQIKRDAVLDAAIGLEAILLREMGDEKYRGESRYRFALNYASLSKDAVDRRARFYEARDLYDLRSYIAHGGTLSPTDKDRKIPFLERHDDVVGAAAAAIEMLRSLIGSFLPSGDNPAFGKAGFWTNALFGIE